MTSSSMVVACQSLVFCSHFSQSTSPTPFRVGGRTWTLHEPFGLELYKPLIRSLRTHVCYKDVIWLLGRRCQIDTASLLRPGPICLSLSKCCVEFVCQRELVRYTMQLEVDQTVFRK